jgi:hypothetical protein
MDTDKLSKKVYALKKQEIISGMVLAIRKEIRLNTGSDMHGRTLPARIEYLVRDKNVKDVWVSERDVVFDKEKIHELIDK